MLDLIIQEMASDGHAHVPKLLSDNELMAINQFFQTHMHEFEAAKVGSLHQKERVPLIRGDFTFWLDPLSPVEPFSGIFSFLEKLKNEINRSFYLGLQEFECHLAYYPPGSFYKTHLDRFEKDGSRRLSFVFYLNQQWSEESGGELILYDRSGALLKKIYPMPGSFICFLSDEFPHEVKQSVHERRSLTGWMHTKIIY